MKDSQDNKKTPMKMEFIFQIGVIVFIVLGAVMKQVSWLFWILGIICAIGWVIFVQKEKRKQDQDK